MLRRRCRSTTRRDKARSACPATRGPSTPEPGGQLTCRGAALPGRGGTLGPRVDLSFVPDINTFFPRLYPSQRKVGSRTWRTVGRLEPSRAGALVVVGCSCAANLPAPWRRSNEEAHSATSPSPTVPQCRGHNSQFCRTDSATARVREAVYPPRQPIAGSVPKWKFTHLYGTTASPSLAPGSGPGRPGGRYR